jgi:hypothetical protein
MSDKRQQKPRWAFIGIKMPPDMYAKARRRARGRSQSYSEYVRQLIVCDIEKETASR